MPDLERRNLQQKAEAFRAMHVDGPILLLANVWDVASARIIEDAGFPSIATSSAGVAFAQGFPDGQQIPRERMIAVVEAIAAAVRVPVTADVEAGYGSGPEDAAQTAHMVIEAGGVGMNFEDATGEREHPLTDVVLQLERVRAIREAAGKLGVALVLNARTDMYLLQVGDPAKRYDETVLRLEAYRDAGADCVFVPGLVDKEAIGRLVKDVRCPVNVLGVAGAPSVGELAALGVRRVSLGSGPMRAGLGVLRKVAQELMKDGTYKMLEGAPPHAEVNRLMSGGGIRRHIVQGAREIPRSGLFQPKV